MKISRLIPAIVAVGAAAGAGLLASNMLSQPEPAPVQLQASAPLVEPVKTIEVLVAAADIEIGVPVEGNFLRWDKWPEESVAGNNTLVRRDMQPSALEELIGNLSTAQIVAGSPIAPKLFVSSESGFMSALLPAGKRAMATELNLINSAGGFVQPNDHVDVLASTPTSTGQLITQILFENVRVLAIGETIRDEEGTPFIQGETATLELTPSQTQILTASRSAGASITLALRSMSDREEESKTNPKLESSSVRMILGGQESTQDFEQR